MHAGEHIMYCKALITIQYKIEMCEVVRIQYSLIIS